MALFSVGRYQCDDQVKDGSSTPVSDHKGKDLLKKLHKRAKSKGQIEDDQDAVICLDTPSGSSKKTAESTVSLETSSSVSKKRRVSESDDAPVAVKMKKKKKLSLSPDPVNSVEAVIEDDDEDSEDPEPSLKTDEDKAAGVTILPNVEQKTSRQVSSVLPDWLANPSVFSADIHNHKTPLCMALSNVECVDDDLKERLKQKGNTSLFPVQSKLIPAVMDGIQTGFMIGVSGYRPSDICCSAPTGSGKTLAFVVPIVQALKQRVICRVRAIAVLPVRDLATQVYKVFTTYCEDTPLKVALLTGQKTFTDEQQSISRKGLAGYRSLVDIIVATPGRLVDHLNKTTGLDLSQLRFLVIDEADRMMQEIKHDWLAVLEHAVDQSKSLSVSSRSLFPTTSSTPPGLLTPAKCRSLHHVPMQKLLFSATLSQNPEKLQLLNLFQPKLFTSVAVADTVKVDAFTNLSTLKKGNFTGKYTTPPGLTEYFIPSNQDEKPLVMLHLLHHLKFRHVLCFTNSVEATHRLYWLVKLFGGIRVQEFSSKLHAQKRARLLRQYAAGEIDLLICSDAMARGMDVEDVRCVVSYEVPPFIKTYIHRVGRTARAGRVGTAITLVEKKQVTRFQNMLKEAGKDNVSELTVKKSSLKPLIEPSQEALKQIPEMLKMQR